MRRKNKEESGLNTSDGWGRPLNGIAWLVAFGTSQTGGFHSRVQLLKQNQWSSAFLIV